MNNNNNEVLTSILNTMTRKTYKVNFVCKFLWSFLTCVFQVEKSTQIQLYHLVDNKWTWMAKGFAVLAKKGQQTSMKIVEELSWKIHSVNKVSQHQCFSKDLFIFSGLEKKLAFSFQVEKQSTSFIEVLMTPKTSVKKLVNKSKQTVTELVNKSKSKITKTINNYKSVVFVL